MSSAAAAASSSSSAVASVAPMSDNDLLTSMGLSPALAAELLSSGEELMEKFGADITVERFLEMHCQNHVRALETYCEQRVQALQQESETVIRQIKAEYAQQ